MSIFMPSDGVPFEDRERLPVDPLLTPRNEKTHGRLNHSPGTAMLPDCHLQIS
jgi:hypothetical protein